jgi:hypothetical protein
LQRPRGPDSWGRLFRFELTPGGIADITPAYELAAKLPSNGCLIGDMGYDALPLRRDLAIRGTATVIRKRRDVSRSVSSGHAETLRTPFKTALPAR